MSIQSSLIEYLQAAAEIYGKQFSKLAAEIFLERLKVFPESQIRAALSKCMDELKTFPTVADILARMDDGRPGVEESWAMIPKDESGSVVWSNEMAGAFDACRELMESDLIAARMTYKEVYTRLCSEARASGKPAVWTPSLGFDKNGREPAIMAAVAKGRLSSDHAQSLLPHIRVPSNFKKLGLDPSKLLPSMPT